MWNKSFTFSLTEQANGLTAAAVFFLHLFCVFQVLTEFAGAGGFFGERPRWPGHPDEVGRPQTLHYQQKQNVSPHIQTGRRMKRKHRAAFYLFGRFQAQGYEKYFPAKKAFIESILLCFGGFLQLQSFTFWLHGVVHSADISMNCFIGVDLFSNQESGSIPYWVTKASSVAEGCVTNRFSSVCTSSSLICRIFFNSLWIWHSIHLQIEGKLQEKMK